MTEPRIHALHVLEDQILLTKAYADSQGNPSALDTAAATIVARRTVDNPEWYVSRLRDNVTLLFLRDNPSTPEDFQDIYRRLEAEWRQGIDKILGG